MPPEAYAALGQMIMLSGQTELYGSAPLLVLLETYIPALHAGCVTFCLNNDQPTGFVIHTFVSDADHQKMLTNPEYLPPVGQWDATGKDRRKVWIVDAVSLNPRACRVLAHTVRKYLPKGTEVFRRKYRGRYVNPDLIKTVIRHGQR